MAGFALALLLSSAALAAPSPGLPCNATGALGNSMGGCTAPPAPPSAKPPPTLAPGQPLFAAPVTFRIRTGKTGQDETIRRNIAAWVAKKAVPHPTSSEALLLNTAVIDLSTSSFPISQEPAGPDLFTVTVKDSTLNSLASRLRQIISSGRLTYRVHRTAVTGGSPGENRFVEQYLPIPPSGIVDAQEVSDTLYQVSQVPGFARADGVFSPAVVVKNVQFDRPLTMTVSDRQAHSFRQIRYQIALNVGEQVLDVSNQQARRVVEEVAKRSSKFWWHPMEIVFGRDKRGRFVRVTVSPKILENLKFSLTEMAQTGIGKENSTSPPHSSTAQIHSLSLPPQKTSFLDEPVQPTIGEIFHPETQSPSLENLLVHVTPAPTFAGSQIEMDNYGYAPTGALMLNATGNVNNAGLPGGLFTVSASTSFGGMNSGTLSYSLPVDLMNRVGADFNAMNYTLGEGFSPWGHGANAAQLVALGVSGSNYSGDAWGIQTFLEKPDRKLALKETLFLKEYQDTYSQTSQNDRSLLGGTLDLSGFRTLGKLLASFDLADTEYDLTQGSGSDPANPFYNDTQGLQNYLTANAQLSYAFTPVWSVTLGTVDQQSFGAGVIDPMLQATLGGVSNVMALPTASLFGNDLYVGTLTLTRTDTAKIGSFSSSLFFDAGQVTGIGTNYSAMGPGVEESVSSQHWFARGDLAVPIGALPTQILGQNITALTGGNIGQGGVPLQLWLSAGLRY